MFSVFNVKCNIKFQNMCQTTTVYCWVYFTSGLSIVREHTQLKFKLIIIQKHICEEVNRINLKNGKQYNCRKT